MAVGNDEVYQAEIQELIAGVPFDALMRTAIQCARRVLPAWDKFAPDDPSVGNALNDVVRLMDGSTSKVEVLKWDDVLSDCVDQASNAYTRTDMFSRRNEESPQGVAANKARWCASAMSALIILATGDEQEWDVESFGGLQKFREGSFAEVVAYSWGATYFDASERRWQLEEIKKLTNRETPERIAKRINELDRYSRRGDFFFFGGLFQMVVNEYDQMIELYPNLAPSHWRRCIALFYDGRYEEGVQQFEAYHSFDDVDRQGGIWRYFCQRKAFGMEQARASLLQYTKEDREPFPDIYRLFAGELTPEEILSRVEEATIEDDEREMRRFYVNLYIGLNEFVEDRKESARIYCEKAVASAWAREAGYGPNFMRHVARLSPRVSPGPSDEELMNDADRFGDNRAWRVW